MQHALAVTGVFRSIRSKKDKFIERRSSEKLKCAPDWHTMSKAATTRIKNKLSARTMIDAQSTGKTPAEQKRMTATNTRQGNEKENKKGGTLTVSVVRL
jgi:hypothetical protein